MEGNREYIDWDLFVKYLSNEVNHFEKKRFETALKENELFEKRYLQVKETWDEAGYALHYQQINKDKAFENVMSRIKTPNNKNTDRKTISRKIYLLSSVAAIALLVGLFFLVYPSGTSVKKLEIASNDQKKSLILSDGSQIDLNQNSQVWYPSEFDRDNRLVEFKGEAFFTIQPDQTKPFIVEVEKLKVRVLGTAFNIKAYPHDDEIIVVVDHGKVEVSFGNDLVVLIKGDKAVVNKHTGSLVKMVNDDVNYNAWFTHHLEFDGTDMAQIIKTINSVYGIHIAVEDPQIMQNRLTATFDQSNPEDIVKVICRTFHLDYVNNNNNYTLLTKR